MSSACYTNKIRVLADAQNTKVQYPGRIANSNNSILSVRNCSPDYSILKYITTKRSCRREFECIIEGGNRKPIVCAILDGNGDTMVFDGNGNC